MTVPILNVNSIGKGPVGTHVRISEPIDMGTNKITSLYVPDATGDIVNYKYYSDNHKDTYIPYVHHKNYIINGDMIIAQRGTSGLAVASGTILLDRWRYYKSGTMVHTMAQGSTTTGPTSQYCLLLTCTVGQASIGAAEYCLIQQPIEGYIFKHLVGKTATLSFWVNSSFPGTYCVRFADSIGSMNYISEYTINTASTWEYKTITLTFDYSSGTWDYTNGVGLMVGFPLATGTSLMSPVNTWTAVGGHASANQKNACILNTTFSITDVMLNEGPTALPFRLFANDDIHEFEACQRYYEKSYDYAVYPGTVDLTGPQVQQTTITESNHSMGMVYYKVRKRTRVSPTIWNTGVASTNSIRNVTDSANIAATVGSYSETNHWVYVTSTSIAAAKILAYHWTVDAELS